ncbi:MAG: type VI secretion system tip protein VgrG [Deltaproteobacteria bacterium]|nr:type VI secretion system tip protein VgrG [Deltaproteobacteria bacterium]
MYDGPWSGRLDASLLLAGHADDLAVHAIRGEEVVSRAFRFEVDFSGRGVDLAGCVRRESQIAIEAPTGERRWISGLVEEASVAPSRRGRSRFRIVVGPRPSLLRWRVGYRVFRDKSVPEIVRAVCADAGLPDDGFEWLLTRAYPKRDYTVQHEESEWSFVCRLLEEEGIWFHFRHDETGHVMVLRDDSTASERVGPMELRYSAEPIVRGSDVRAWDGLGERRLAETTVTLDDYDMLHPSNDLRADARVEDAVSAEWYEHPGKYDDARVGKRLAETRLRERRLGCDRLALTANAVSVTAGGLLELVDHPDSSGVRFVVSSELEVRLDAEDDGEGPLVTPSSSQACVVRLDTVPVSAVFVPPRVTPRPQVIGMRTARVVGPEGEEIHCDEHGRVRLEQHWDLEGGLDGRSSPWVRVTQPHTTGSVLIPRIGWEVLVEHVDGDPDRPLCLGRLYDALHPPAYRLPEEKTVSGIRSDSSPGAGGIHEIRMDDTAGGELLSVVAKRDVTTMVANDRRQQIEKTASRKVGRHRRVEIGGTETVTVGEDENARVKTTHAIEVIGSRTVRVSGGGSFEVTRDVVVDVKGREQLRVGNPLDAVLKMAKDAAIQAAQGLAAKGVSATVDSLGPMAVMNAARGELGGLGGSFSGKSLLGAGAASSQGSGVASPLRAATSPSWGPGGAFRGRGAGGADLLGGLGLPTGVPGLPVLGADAPMDDPAVAAAGLAASVVDGAFERLGLGGGDAGGGGGADGSGKGTGTWGVVVEKNVREDVGGAASIASGAGISFQIGGDSSEKVGLARTEVIRGGKSESVTEKKVETVGSYAVESKTSLAVTAKLAIVRTIEGAQKQKITGGHALSAKLVADLSTADLTLDAKQRITLTCGESEIVVGADGVSIKGKEIVFEADEILVEPPAIKKK